ncbi:MAG: SufD family Fe-S cluster assembly protein, partial [Candidatus Diapherotrites archaeon]|nr:SufD family Fe-S cluster assembly protein [Candidatus Diapherotrites archaeon]
NWTELSLGGKQTLPKTTTLLQAEGAETKNYGVILGSKKQDFNINVQAIHENSHTTSNLITKTVLNDQAHANYKGLIKINSKAVNCNGHQKEDALLLSDNAKIHAVPILEIGNDDVTCSHGTTISQVDSDKLFYLMSRGLDEKTAKQSIVQGFFDPIIQTINNEDVKQQLEQAINEKLGAIA